MQEKNIIENPASTMVLSTLKTPPPQSTMFPGVRSLTDRAVQTQSTQIFMPTAPLDKAKRNTVAPKALNMCSGLM